MDLVRLRTESIKQEATVRLVGSFFKAFAGWLAVLVWMRSCGERYFQLEWHLAIGDSSIDLARGNAFAAAAFVACVAYASVGSAIHRLESWSHIPGAVLAALGALLCAPAVPWLAVLFGVAAFVLFGAIGRRVLRPPYSAAVFEARHLDAQVLRLSHAFWKLCAIAAVIVIVDFCMMIYVTL